MVEFAGARWAAWKGRAVAEHALDAEHHVLDLAVAPGALPAERVATHPPTVER